MVNMFVLQTRLDWQTPWPYLLVAGALLAISFACPNNNLAKRLALGLAQFPLSMLSAFSDVISYVRLMAVGLASTVLAVSFNTMAANADSWALAACILTSRPQPEHGPGVDRHVRSWSSSQHARILQQSGDAVDRISLSTLCAAHAPGDHDMTTELIPFDLPVILPTLFAATDTFWRFLGEMGDVLALGLAALGSAIGTGMAGQAAAGAWSKEARAGKNLSFTYIILVGMPISQTLYAMIVMNNMRSVFDNAELAVNDAGLLLGIGLATGIGQMLSAWMQGLVGAAGIRGLSDGEGKGLAFIIIVMGIVETVGIFTMVFLLGMIPSV